MNAMKRGKSGKQSIYVPTRHGGLVQRATGSRDPKVVRGMKKMCGELKDRSMVSGNWSVLDAVFAKRLKLSTLYTAYTSNRLAELESDLSSANLSSHLAGWIAWVRGNRRDDVRTADVYWQQVTTLVPEQGSFLSSELTKARVIAWLTSREKASSGTKRKYLAALRSFVHYLTDTGILASNPLAGLKPPKKNPARRRWVTVDVDESIVKAALPKYRALFAFIKGTGCDVGSALRAQIGDVNLFASSADIRGTKTDRRHVHQAVIEAWAVPYIRRHIQARPDAKADALLFEGIGDRKPPSQHHANVCAKLGVKDYTLKDSRHSVGVRMRKAGKSFEQIAAQLGTSVYQVVNVYSVYTIDATEQRDAK